MIFPPNNLPTASKNWAREVEKKVTNLESSFRSAEVNNVTRDSQLSVTANAALNAATQAQSAAAQAQVAADDAADAAALAQTAANNAQAAINGLGSLDEATSTYKINAENITVGSLSGNRISGGEIVGTLLRTASSGARVQLNLNDIAFYDDTGDYSGKIDAQGDGRSSTLNIDSQGLSGMYLYNGGLELYANGPVGVNATQLISYGAFSTTGAASVSQSLTVSGATNANGGVSTTSVSASSISNSGTYTGNGFPTVGANTVSGASFPANTFVSSTGNLARKTDASERRLKENINELDFDAEAFININPVTFNYKREAVSDDDQAARKNIGFILDDFEDAGLDEFLVFQAEGDDFKQLRYDLMAIYLHKVVQNQNQTIKDLTARIEALESR